MVKLSVLRVLDWLESKYFIYVTMAWFVLQGSFMAATTRFAIPPDERYHQTFIELYRGNNGSPFLSGPQVGYEWLGDVTRATSYLYHYVFAQLSSINDGLVFLRLLNVAMGAATIYLFYRLLKQLEVSRLATGLSVFMLANTLMFVWLSAAINYDNAMILLAMASMLLLVSFMKKPTINIGLGLLLVTALAVLVKFSFVPLGLPLLATAIYYAAKNRQILGKNLKYQYAHRKVSTVVLSLGLLFATGLVAERYIGNLIHHNSFMPSCQKIQTEAYCSNNPIVQRSKFIKENPVEPEYNQVTYVPTWLKFMRDSTFSAAGHQRSPAFIPINAGILLLCLAALVAFGLKLNWRKDNLLVYLVVAGLVYVLAVYFVDYKAYARSGRLGLAVQGRYLFPVLPLFYAVAAEYPLRVIRNKAARALFALFIIAIFIFASLPNYLVTSTQKMRSDSFGNIYDQAHEFACGYPIIFETEC